MDINPPTAMRECQEPYKVLHELKQAVLQQCGENKKLNEALLFHAKVSSTIIIIKNWKLETVQVLSWTIRYS